MHMQVYQDLCKKHTTFRERSENVDLAVSWRKRGGRRVQSQHVARRSSSDHCSC